MRKITRIKKRTTGFKIVPFSHDQVVGIIVNGNSVKIVLTTGAVLEYEIYNPLKK